jgi:hypothetical protein
MTISMSITLSPRWSLMYRRTQERVGPEIIPGGRREKDSLVVG